MHELRQNRDNVDKGMQFFKEMLIILERILLDDSSKVVIVPEIFT